MEARIKNASAMPSISEGRIQAQILQFLAFRGVFAWRNHSVGVYDQQKGILRKSTGLGSMRGVPDILGVLEDGRMLAIEVKSRSGRVSIHQAKFIEEATKLGALAFVARSIEDVQKALAKKP